MVDFSELFIYFLGLIGAGLSAVIAYWVKRAADKFGIETTEKMNGLINEAIEKSLGWAAQKLNDDGKKLTKSFQNEFVENAVRYATQGTPKAMRSLGLTEDRVREMVEARLAGQIPDDEEDTK